MFDFHEKRKIKSWIFSKTAIVVLVVLSGLLGMSVFERYEKERETAIKHEERALELRELESRAAVLEAKVKYMESERGIEEEIRDRYDVVKEGEQAVVVMEALSETSSSTRPPVVIEEEEGLFSWFLFWR